MKKYTLAWLAFMAIKRLSKEELFTGKKGPELAKEAASLVDWFMNYRDFVIQGAWYPNLVFDDQETSHVAKYVPAERFGSTSPFKSLPQGMKVDQLVKKNSTRYKEKGFSLVQGNLCDRCNAMYHTIYDNFKIQFREEKGNPISPSANHLGMRFFMMAHYIADGHMPMHCDARQLNRLQNCIGSAWECAVRCSYKIDLPNERFFYDRYGYPKKADKVSLLLRKVEEEILKREFVSGWGSKNSNLYDYMRAVTQRSYLMSYEMVPADLGDLGWKDYKGTEIFKKHFVEYSVMILSDAIDSIARAWLNVWMDFHNWNPYKKAQELYNGKEIFDEKEEIEE